METDSKAPILLGRPFISTSETKLDVKNGSLTMEFDGKVVRFNVFDVMTFPKNVQKVCAMDLKEPIIEEEVKVEKVGSPKSKPEKKKKGEPPRKKEEKKKKKGKMKWSPTGRHVIEPKREEVTLNKYFSPPYMDEAHVGGASRPIP